MRWTEGFKGLLLKAISFLRNPALDSFIRSLVSNKVVIYVVKCVRAKTWQMRGRSLSRKVTFNEAGRMNED